MSGAAQESAMMPHGRDAPAGGEGGSAGPTLPAGATRERLAWVLVAAFALFVLRFLSANFGQFSEGDEISIAAGVAALHRGVPGDAYRYGLQSGYYHLVSLLTGLVGGGLYTIGDVMVALSVAAGTAIPVAGVFAFRDTLTRGERWLLCALLAANPVIWQSSRYGNTAMTSVALTVLATVILSNRPQLKGEVAALVLFGGAVLVRADAVLVSGAVLALLWRRHGRFWRAAVPLAVTGAVVGGIVALQLLVDPRMGDVLGAVASHTENPISTRFAEFLLFGMSPIPLLMAAAGARDLQRERAILLAVLGAWVVPLIAFYFTNTTTPRYLLQLMFPLSIAAAVGVAGSIAKRPGWKVLSGAAVLGLTFVHLFVGLSDFAPSKRRSWLTEAILRSDDGPVWTGALLYKTFVMRPAHMGPAWAQRRFRPANEVERSLVQIFDTLASGTRRARRIVLVAAPGYGNEVHFFAHVAGVRMTAAEPGIAFNRVTRMELGGAELVTVGIRQLEQSETAVPARTGDEVWALYPSQDEAERALARHLPAGTVLRAESPWPRAGRLWRYTLAVAS